MKAFRVIHPVFFDLNKDFEVNAALKQIFEFFARSNADAFQVFSALTEDNAFMAGAVDVDHL